MKKQAQCADVFDMEHRSNTARKLLVWGALIATITLPEALAAHEMEGLASWYGGKFQGRLTANGEIFDTNDLTAAHRTLPFDTEVLVTNTRTGHSVVVRINDRGPFVDGRVIDLSRAAASRIGIVSTGIGPVQLEILSWGEIDDDATIQVASFSKRGNAEAVLERLRAYNLAPQLEHDAARGLHRVVIVDIPNNEVDLLRARLAALGYGNVLIRRE